ncbi:cyclopropane-fatty-acyl-phospholipid synthase [Hydrogenivirga caldilitoris]|uniref:Cyclopropane-fatty-acyl-phospholipid synthase n=1 Tax=Hydrogenivirga caldilitoris TaxID=246264 RepID=A0A497XQP4_9AQUI|nr:class I SAM-dependent methyltransferase [Hydrogenivirga caldilitoris]RLJ70574.1 cyclopropane-fatty-acyl-phospholipid synthase [Hydrogenivirga caldilitoris]
MKGRLLEKILKDINHFSDEGIGVRLPDGKNVPEGNVTHRVVFKSWKALDRVLKDPEMGFGEGYMRGEIEIEGDLEKVLVAGNRYINNLEGNRGFSVLFFKVVNTLSFINKLKEKENIKRHYDLGNDFYKLWLDESMTYSCAFFSSPNMSLEEAQREKRKIIYEKLQLEEGDRLLDIGCGWGSIILESAENYGVRSVGITLSENQYEYVKGEIKRRGLEDRVEVYLMHYADLPELERKFNKVVSVGMFEHVGREHYKAFFNTVNRVMDEGGLFLLHTIGKVHPSTQSRWIRKYIFPGGYLPGIPEVLCAFEGLNFCLIDIDDWRIHYYMTLREWRKRFWDRVEEVKGMYGEEFVRMWDLYLVASAVSFYVGSNHLFQFLLSKGVKNDYPVMRRVFLETPALLS